MAVKVVVVGSAGIDLVTYVKNFPRSGETIIGKSFEQKFGGKGANQAVILSRLGSTCGFCGTLGQDSYGDMYLQQLNNEGVNITGISRKDSVSTGIACITVEETGSNMIIINPGANYHLSKDHIGSTLTAFQSASVLICQNEILPECTLFALELGKQFEMLTIFNPAPISSDRETLWKSILMADIICPNETELFELLEQKFPVESIEDIRLATHHLHQQGVKIVIVTLGSRGAFLSTNHGHTELIPAPVVENCIDTVGAGDCFVGTLAHHLSFGSSLSSAISKATQCASVSVTRKGAQESYPSREECVSLGLVHAGDVVLEKNQIRQLHGLN